MGSLTVAAGWLMASPRLQPAEKQHREPGEKSYASFIHLAKQTANELSGLDPRDRIDIQSFIWVAGNYREDQEDVHP